LCCVLLLLHIWLDVVTTYGTMVFLPFSHYRVRLNSVYIIDLLLTVPLLWAVWRWRSRRGLILLTLAWMFIYPGSGIGINAWHTAQARERFAEEGRTVSRLHVLPDAFAPFFWRVIFEEGETVASQSLDALGRPRAPEETYPATPLPLVAAFSRASVACDTYFQFAMLPVMDSLRPEDMPPLIKEGTHEGALFYDLRFGSGLAFVRRLLAMRPNADIPFQLMVELGPAATGAAGAGEPKLEALRLRFSDSGRDSHWHAPVAPTPPSFWQWLVGLR
ncbi:MAG: metal-dependent hydrolase, partial [Desulfovibrio sp.]|nr:metal-dependent hydrolase [Desulfovibrio sp.]